MNTQRGNALGLGIVLIALAVIAFFTFRTNRSDEVIPPTGEPLGAQTQIIVREGVVTCLPHRDTTGPTTMECAYGLKTESGEYYGLDTSGLSVDKQGGYDVGQQVSFEGTLVGERDIPESVWSTYNIVGLIEIVDYWVYRDK